MLQRDEALKDHKKAEEKIADYKKQINKYIASDKKWKNDQEQMQKQVAKLIEDNVASQKEIQKSNKTLAKEEKEVKQAKKTLSMNEKKLLEGAAVKL